MKARIIKKLSKKLVEAAPVFYADAWIDCEVIEQAYNQGSRISHVWSMGGGVDCWGEGEDTQTALQYIQSCWFWLGDFLDHPEDHEFYGCPDTGSFKPTGKNLLKIAREIK